MKRGVHVSEQRAEKMESTWEQDKWEKKIKTECAERKRRKGKCNGKRKVLLNAVKLQISPQTSDMVWILKRETFKRAAIRVSQLPFIIIIIINIIFKPCYVGKQGSLGHFWKMKCLLSSVRWKYLQLLRATSAMMMNINPVRASKKSHVQNKILQKT